MIMTGISDDIEWHNECNCPIKEYTRKLSLVFTLQTSDNLRVYVRPRKSFIEVYIFKLFIRLRRYDTF